MADQKSTFGVNLSVDTYWTVPALPRRPADLRDGPVPTAMLRDQGRHALTELLYSRPRSHGTRPDQQVS